MGDFADERFSSTLTFLSRHASDWGCQTGVDNIVNADLPIRSIVQQTMVFTAQLATAGGVRVPLASLANQILLDLANELRHQGLKHSVIADMFGAEPALPVTRIRPAVPLATRAAVTKTWIDVRRGS